jgi:hypothetical protein
VREACCFAWAQLLSAAARHRENKLTAYTLARYASLAFRSGRRFAGGSQGDVLSDGARRSGAVLSLDAIHVGEEDSSTGPAHRFAVLTPSRIPKPAEVARRNCDYALVADDPALSLRVRNVFRRLVADHDKGCFSRIARVPECPRPMIVVSIILCLKLFRAALSLKFLLLETLGGLGRSDV